MSTDDVLSPAATLATSNSPITKRAGKKPVTGDESPYTPMGVQLGGSRDNACITPDGQDTPKYEDVLAQVKAQEKEAALAGGQTPPKTVWTHDTTSGITPPGGGDREKFILRPPHIKRKYPDLPGSSEGNPVFVDTPTRDKK